MHDCENMQKANRFWRLQKAIDKNLAKAENCQKKASCNTNSAVEGGGSIEELALFVHAVLLTRVGREELLSVRWVHLNRRIQQTVLIGPVQLTDSQIMAVCMQLMIIFMNLYHSEMNILL